MREEQTICVSDYQDLTKFWLSQPPIDLDVSNEAQSTSGYDQVSLQVSN